MESILDDIIEVSDENKKLDIESLSEVDEKIKRDFVSFEEFLKTYKEEK